MFAHRVVALTGPAAVQWTQVEEPAADDGVVIDVVAAGVSFADLLQTTGAYQLKVPLPFTPGMDAAGTVRSARPDLGLAAGQRVAVLLPYGCWQEVISAPAERVLPLPDDLTFEAGAALPLNYLTGLLALVRRGRAQPGKTLLVHGAAGGVGRPRSSSGGRWGCGRSRLFVTRPNGGSWCSAGPTMPSWPAAGWMPCASWSGTGRSTWSSTRSGVTG
jgi:NADPH:quinone reductase-like Zn-dependent oxidoreductase